MRAHPLVHFRARFCLSHYTTPTVSPSRIIHAPAHPCGFLVRETPFHELLTHNVRTLTHTSTFPHSLHIAETEQGRRRGRGARIRLRRDQAHP
jgi:hypothetical protein